MSLPADLIAAIERSQEGGDSVLIEFGPPLRWVCGSAKWVYDHSQPITGTGLPVVSDGALAALRGLFKGVVR